GAAYRYATRPAGVFVLLRCSSFSSLAGGGTTEGHCDAAPRFEGSSCRSLIDELGDQGIIPAGLSARPRGRTDAVRRIDGPMADRVTRPGTSADMTRITKRPCRAELGPQAETT